MTRNQTFAIAIMQVLSSKMDASVQYDASGDSLKFIYESVDEADRCFVAVTKIVTIYHHQDDAKAQKYLEHIKGIIAELEKRYE